MKIAEWIINNKEWIFSGIGVFIIGIFFTMKNTEKKNTQKGRDSVQIQNVKGAFL